MAFPRTQFSTFLHQRKQFVEIEDTKIYKRARVQLHWKGVVLRDELEGALVKTKDQQIAREGELLVAEIDAKVGGVGIVPLELDGAIVSSHYFLFGIDESKCLRSWLDWFVRSGGLGDQFTARGSTNYAAIRPHHVLNCEIPLPPLDEQRRIISRIEEIAAKIDVVGSLRKSAENLATALFESSLRYAFDEFARHYPSRPFQAFCEVVRGGSPRPAGSPVYYDGSIPFLKVADLTADSDKYLHSYTSTIKEAGLSRTRYVDAGTLMLTNSGATLGVPKICMFPTTFNDGIQAFLNIPATISKEYLYYFFRSKTRWFREQCARGQGQPNLNTEMVKRLSVPVPPAVAQTELVQRLDDVKAKVDDLTQAQTETTARLSALMPSILSKAFHGEL